MAPARAPERLAQAIKRMELHVLGFRPIERAISTAGGVTWASLGDGLQLRALPGVFCAGEMMDWDAPTGGYLLQACFATGKAAAEGALSYANAARAKRSAP
jgi:hypothetical protein